VYKITTGVTKNGSWWSRLESDTHYAVGKGDTEWDAVNSAVQEAMGIIRGSQRYVEPARLGVRAKIAEVQINRDSAEEDSD
jgi:hypothetical protein